MTVSERLRELIEPPQAFGLACPELGPGLHDFVLLSDYEAFHLPLIADVVEAAEMSVDIGNEFNRCRLCWEVWGAHDSTCPLIALRDSLGAA